jgi:hypothetical protein
LLSTHYPDGTYTSNWFDKLDLVGARDRMGYWTRYVYNQVRQRTVIDRYDRDVKGLGATREQLAIDKAGGIINLDNKINAKRCIK